MPLSDFYPCRPSDPLCGECGAHTSSYFQIDEHIICPACAEKMDLDDLADRFGVDSVSELFVELGIPFSGLFDGESEDRP